MTLKFVGRRGAAIISLTLFGLVKSWAGAQPERLELAGESWEVHALAQDDFSDPHWSRRWTLEGNAKVEVEPGGLRVATSSNKAVEQVATLWWHQSLPADVLIELTAEMVGPFEDNAARACFQT